MPIIETSRLILRPPLPQDFETFAQAQNDSEFKKHTGGIMPRSQAWEEFCDWRDYWTLKGFCFFSVVEKQTGEWLGRVGPTKRAAKDFSEFGWAIIRSQQGKGYAFEAANAAIYWAQQKHGWSDAYFCIAEQNTVSQFLAKKIGAINIGTNKLPTALENQGVEVWHKILQT